MKNCFPGVPESSRTAARGPSYDQKTDRLLVVVVLLLLLFLLLRLLLLVLLLLLPFSPLSSRRLPRASLPQGLVGIRQA